MNFHALKSFSFSLRKARAKKTTQRGGYDKADRILYKAKALERWGIIIIL